ncbi:hypothetical protein ACTXO9_07350 [Brachybacterium tyrofermentans]|uniref:hypothetical protein n=1 Tax=Brachybacterium tyrofermentans TaxID=47848 RepID=UPI003FD68ECE
MSAPVQLDLDMLLDGLEDRPYTSAERARFRWQGMRARLDQWENGRAETFQDRRSWGCIRPGEACPTCGHRFQGHVDGGNNHHHLEVTA